MTSGEIDEKISFFGITLDLVTTGGLRRADFFRQVAKESMTENAQVNFCHKIGEEKTMNHQYFSARVESTGIPTWNWWGPAVKTWTPSIYDSMDHKKSSFRGNGWKMIENQNGLTRSSFPCSAEKNLFFWPALFPDEILALRHRFFNAKSLTLGRWLSCP